MTAERSFFSYRILMATFFVVTIGFLGFTLWAHTQLPDRVPVHFDGAGKPDRISSKMELTVVNLCVGVSMIALFGILPFFLEKIPNRLWNLSNKDYWLAPERKKETVDRVNIYYVGMGLATMLLMWFVMGGAYLVGMGKSETLPYSWWGIGIYFALITWMCIAMFRAFPKPPKEP
jgi:uncharacterized membrane protein